MRLTSQFPMSGMSPVSHHPFVTAASSSDVVVKMPTAFRSAAEKSAAFSRAAEKPIAFSSAAERPASFSSAADSIS